MSNIKACAAFVKAQAAFGPALKANKNPAFKTLYADLNSCIDAVMGALNANGLALMQIPLDCESGVMIETIFIHESGEILSGGKFRAPVSKQDAQGYGSATTYARRYGLMAACGIAPEDDDGNAAAKAPHQPAKQSPAPATDPVAEIVVGVNRGDAAGAAGYLASLTPADLDAIWSKLPPAIAEKLTAAWPA